MSSVEYVPNDPDNTKPLRPAIAAMLDALDPLDSTQRVKVLRACVGLYSLEEHVKTQSPYMSLDDFEQELDLPPPFGSRRVAPITFGQTIV